MPDLRSLAYQLAERNNIPNNFNKETKLAGKDWVRGFRKRHPEIVLREPEATSAARAQAFNKTNVGKFYDILEEVQKNHLYPPHRVFNVDETGLMTVQSKTSKVFALKGRRQVGSLTSAERGVLSTFVVCMSAGGMYIPPFIIFPRVRMKAELQDGAPPGTAFACHSSGWMQTEIFTQWFEHFLKYAKPSKEDPVLLILDGHATHTKNLDFIEKARDSSTTVVCIPPHCSHKMQPLDVSFMGPFNTYYVQAIERFLRNNPGRVVTQYQVSRLLGEAFLLASTPTIAVKGFRKCGIVPINRNVFTELDFAAANTTDICDPSAITPTSECVQRSHNSGQKDNAKDRQDKRQAEKPCKSVDRQHSDDLQEPNELPDVIPLPASISANELSQAGTSTAARQLFNSNRPTSSAEIQICKPSTSSAVGLSPLRTTGRTSPASILNKSFTVSPGVIFPIPKVQVTKRPNKRKKGSAAVLTSSPYKNDLLAVKTEKEEKERLKKMKLELKKEKEKTKKQTKKIKALGKKKVQDDNDSAQDSESDVSDVECLLCGENYSKSKENEGWIRCSGCLHWAHEACAGCEEEDDDFICDLCKNF